MEGGFPSWGGMGLGRIDNSIRLEGLQESPGLQGLSFYCFWKVEDTTIRERGCPEVR